MSVGDVVKQRRDLGLPDTPCPEQGDMCVVREDAATINGLVYLLAVYVHAHQTGNSVPPHIDTQAQKAIKENR